MDASTTGRYGRWDTTLSIHNSANNSRESRNSQSSRTSGGSGMTRRQGGSGKGYGQKREIQKEETKKIEKKMEKAENKEPVNPEKSQLRDFSQNSSGTSK